MAWHVLQAESGSCGAPEETKSQHSRTHAEKCNSQVSIHNNYYVIIASLCKVLKAYACTVHQPVLTVRIHQGVICGSCRCSGKMLIFHTLTTGGMITEACASKIAPAISWCTQINMIGDVCAPSSLAIVLCQMASYPAILQQPPASHTTRRQRQRHTRDCKQNGNRRQNGSSQ